MHTRPVTGKSRDDLASLSRGWNQHDERLRNVGCDSATTNERFAKPTAVVMRATPSAERLYRRHRRRCYENPYTGAQRYRYPIAVRPEARSSAHAGNPTDQHDTGSQYPRDLYGLLTERAAPRWHPTPRQPRPAPRQADSPVTDSRGHGKVGDGQKRHRLSQVGVMHF